MRILALRAGLPLIASLLAQSAAAGTLDEVKKRGKLICGVAPNIPGERVYLTEPPGQSDSTDIPDVAAFKINPGSLRDAENTLLAQTQTEVTGYMELRAKVIESYGWNWGMGVHDTDKIKRIQDNMLLAVASSIHMSGVYVAKLNDAAQTYADADNKSKPPAPT